MKAIIIGFVFGFVGCLIGQLIAKSIAKKNTKAINNIRNKFSQVQETNYVFSEYVSLISDICVAVRNNSPYVPIKDWLKRLDNPKFVEKRDESLESYIQTLKSQLIELTHELKTASTTSTGYTSFYVIQEKNKRTGKIDYCCLGYNAADCECGSSDFWRENPFYKDVEHYTENQLEYAKEGLEMWRNGMRSEDYTFKIVKFVINYRIEDIEREANHELSL